MIQGHQADSVAGGIIRVDHGLDTAEISTGVGIDADLNETAFIVEADYRLGRLKQPNSSTIQGVNFIDDDNIATYYVGQGSFINPNGAPSETNIKGDLTGAAADTTPGELSVISPQVFDGPRGNTFQFRIEASMELQQSVYLFNQIGSSESVSSTNNIAGFPTSGVTTPVDGKKIYYIDSTVRVVGANTGYRLDIPVRYIKIAN